MIQAISRRLIAILVLEFFVSNCSTSFGESDSTVLANQQVIALYKDGKYREAIPIAEKLLAIRRKALPPDDTTIAESTNNLALLYRAIGEYSKAEPLFQQFIQITERVFGPNDLASATSIRNLALLYSDMGRYAKAEPLFQQSLKITKRALGLDHPDTATSLDDLANIYETLGDYVKAEPLFRQALQIRKRVLGTENAATASSLDSLGQFYFDTGDYAKAEPLCRQALEVRERLLGPEHPDTAISLDQVAEICFERSDYARAEPLFQQALQIKKKVFGPESADVATTLNDLAVLYEEMGDYAKAEGLFQQALKICTTVFGTQHIDTARSLNNLGSLYNTIGDYTKAEPLFQQALEITTTVLGPEGPYTVTSLNNLALVYREMGDYAKAEPLFQQALQIREKVLGTLHPNTARSLHNLASLYFQMRNYAKAQPLYQQALRIYKRALGPEHPNTAICLNDLAQLYQAMGDYDSAEPLVLKALHIDRKALGLKHLYTAVDLDNLGLLKVDRKQLGNVISIAQLSAKAHLALLSKILSFASERQRLVYQNNFDPYTLLVLLRGNELDLALAVLRYKGVVLDSLIEDRLVAEASKNSADKELLVQLATDKRRLGQLLLEIPDGPTGETNKTIETLENEVETIEGQLARHTAIVGSARRALTVSVTQVQAVIPETGVLIEYLRYRHYLGQGRFEPRYGAVVLFPRGVPKWIPLGVAAEVDSLVSDHQRLARGASAGRNALSDNLQALYRELWAPIVRVLPPEVTRVIISPDGQLNFVSFATLLDPEDDFLAEKYSVQYVCSGRDLLREARPTPGRAVSVFANPDFGAGSPTQAASGADHGASSVPESSAGRPKIRELEGKSFPRLGGTQKECEELTKGFRSRQWSVNALTGKDATKAALLQVDSPYILHLATHGFFEGAKPKAKDSLERPATIGQESAATAKFFENPMHRSGLALAGANATLRAWERGEPPALKDDGIVTAEDVAALHLNDSWLVALSACDTGEGEAKAGEGVLGLRRGFLQAGTQNLLMSLWRESDTGATKFMRDFYERARQAPSAPEALAAVQREWLTAIRRRQGLEQAVSLAGPFIMSSQGKP
jgi:tetratricopeptide (TPR) repeat protein/CHAT domain-containing protein